MPNIKAPFASAVTAFVGLIPALLPLALGCDPEVPKLFDPCDAEDCEQFDADPNESDHVIALDDDAFGYIDLNGEGSNVSVSGEVVIHAEDATCMATPATPCSITLKRLRVGLGSMMLPSSIGDFAWDDVSASIEVPLELVDQGSGYIVPSETLVQTCGLVDGREDAGISEVGTASSIDLDFEGQFIGIDITLPLVVSVGHRSCDEWKLQVTVVAAGVRPWEQVPE